MPRINKVYMATYKKRGYKPKTKAEKVEAIEEQSATAGVFKTLDESASKTEEWVAANQKYIFIIIGLVAVVVLGYLGFNKFIAEPKQESAMNDMYHAQSMFNEAISGTQTEKDSLFTLALNGSGGKFGLLDIIEEYKGTPAANLSNYYAGMSYLQMKDYKNSITYLSKYKSDDEAIAPLAKGGIGDSFVQLNQLEDALGYYEDAAKMRKNDFTTPMYLYKAGTIALELGKSEKALQHFNTIKEDFPKSAEAANIDVFIGKAEALK